MSIQTADMSVNAANDAAEAMRSICHLKPGELSIADIYAIVGSLNELQSRLPQTLSHLARIVERLAEDPTLDHDGTAGTGAADRSAAERADQAALNIDRALVDDRALSRAHCDLGTLKRR